MAIKQKFDTKVAEGDMTAMIDMVFQLIIFFMLVMNIEQAQAAFRRELAKYAALVKSDTERYAKVIKDIGLKID